ncbi:MAG TPA: hypothetical protein VJY35_02705 [Candidatus Eisenbacteria bacterium]|nr:hypothetical protein [Candidatus Eisenbacteria bacterium]
MKRGIVAVVLMSCIALILVAGSGGTVPLDPEKMPEVVAATFRAVFPNGTIQKLDVAEENGVMVYDFEFTAGAREKETDIIGDGTMIESTLVITRADIPPAAMKTILKHARGATMGRMEWIETFYDLEGGKAVKLPKSKITYAVELTRPKQTAEVMVDPAGKVTEAPVWTPKPGQAK